MATPVPPQTVTFKIDKPTANTAVPTPVVAPVVAPVVPKEKPKLDEFFAKPVPNTVVESTTTSTTTTDTPIPVFKSVQDKVAEFDEPPKKGNGLAIFAVLAVAFLGGLYYYRAEVSQKIHQIGSHVRPNKEVSIPATENENSVNVEPEQSTPYEKPKRKNASVLEARDYYLRVLNDDQSVSVRTGGSLAWRIHNPCRILYGKFAAGQGAFDKADRFSVFKGYEAGRKACYELLFKSEHGYKQLTVNDAMKRFAPTSEGFKPITYVKAMSKAGISSTSEMDDLSESKRQKMIDVIMEVEGFIPGRVVEFDSEADFNKRGY